FVFFQGHPEYDAVTLLLEYRRDLGRYLRGERDAHPAMPKGYLDEETERELERLRQRALVDRREALLADFPTATAAAGVRNKWRASVGDRTTDTRECTNAHASLDRHGAVLRSPPESSRPSRGVTCDRSGPERTRPCRRGRTSARPQRRHADGVRTYVGLAGID